MQEILIYIVFVLLGVGAGIILRKTRGNKGPIPWISAIKSVSICVLLFVMSTRIGSNDEVAKNLGTIVVYGLVFTIIVIISTIGVAFLTRRMLGFNSRGTLVKDNLAKENFAKEDLASNGRAHEESASVSEKLGDADAKVIEREPSDSKSPIDKTTIQILVFVALGILVGYFLVDKIFSDYDKFVELASLAIKIGLSTLLFFVGFDLGYEESGMGDFKKAGFRIVFFPIATIIGTLAGGVIAFFLMPISMKESLAIASGFGWYSLAPVIIMDAGYITASAISFIHNVLRELLAILFVPLVAKYVGYIEASCVPGAPGMDICLPVVERSTNGTIAIYSFITGSVTSLLVPVLVSLFIS